MKFQAGVIEGFFGRSWGWPARLDNIDFLSGAGYQFYVYAPKADAFLRRRWREPLPAQTLLHLQELGGQCKERGISLGVGLTPFEIYLDYDAGAQRSLRAKVEQINAVDVPMLCILFDDMRGDLDGLAGLQARIIDDICSWSTAQHFVVCPTYYSLDPRLTRVFGSPPASYLRDLGRLLDPSIDMFWTGEKVISEGYSAAHLLDVAAAMGRKPFIWDNWISNDTKIRTNHLFLDPAVGSWNLAAGEAAGIAINPMNQPYLSRIALRGMQARLKKGAEQQSLEAICRDLAGSLFAKRVVADIEVLQSAGLAGLSAEMRRDLLSAYAMDNCNPYAREIAAWLRGEYVFDPQCLTA